MPGGDRLVEAVALHQLGDRRRLAAGNDEAGALVELLGQSNGHRADIERLKRVDVLSERSLKREDSDAHATSPAGP